MTDMFILTIKLKLVQVTPSRLDSIVNLLL